MSCYVATIVHCGQYLERVLGIVTSALQDGNLPSLDQFRAKLNTMSSIAPFEDKYYLLPASDEFSNAKTMDLSLLQQAATPDGTLLTDLFSKLFDNFMASLLRILIAYINADESRRIAAKGIKRDKDMEQRLSSQMVEKVRKLAEDRAVKSVERESDLLREICQLQSRLASIEAETAIKTTSKEEEGGGGGGGLYVSVSSPFSLKQSLSSFEAVSLLPPKDEHGRDGLGCFVAAELVIAGGWFPGKMKSNEEQMRARGGKCSEEESQQKAGQFAASVTQWNKCISTGIAEATHKCISKGLPPPQHLQQQATMHLIGFADINLAMHFVAAAATASHCGGGGVAWPVFSIVACPSNLPPQYAAGALRLLRYQPQVLPSPPICVLCNFDPSAPLPAEATSTSLSKEFVFSIAKEADSAVLSATMPCRATVWIGVPKRSTAKLSISPEDVGPLFTATERWAVELEGFAPVPLPGEGSLLAVTIPHFLDVMRCSHKDARQLAAVVLFAIRRRAAQFRGIELAPPTFSAQTAELIPFRFFAVFEDSSGALRCAVEAAADVERSATFPSSCESALRSTPIKLQSAVATGPITYAIAERGAAPQYASDESGSTLIFDVTATGYTVEKCDAFVSLSKPGQIVASSDVEKTVEESPMLSNVVAVEKIVPQALSQNTKLRPTFLKRVDAIEADSKCVGCISVSTLCPDSVHWLRKVDPQAAEITLELFDQLLKKEVVKSKGCVLGYCAEDGSCVVSHSSPLQSVEFVFALTSQLQAAEWDVSLLRYKDLAPIVIGAQLVFRGPRLRIGISSCSDSSFNGMDVVLRSLLLCEDSVPGEIVCCQAAATAIYSKYSSSLAERTTPGQRGVQASIGRRPLPRVTPQCGKLPPSMTYRIGIPDFPMRAKLVEEHYIRAMAAGGAHYLSEDHHFTQRTATGQLWKLKLAVATGTAISAQEEARGMEQLGAAADPTQKGKLPVITSAAASNALRTLHSGGSWEPGQYIRGLFDPVPSPPHRAFFLTSRDAERIEKEKALAEEKRRIPFIQFSEEKYALLRQAFEEAYSAKIGDDDDGGVFGDEEEGRAKRRNLVLVKKFEKNGQPAISEMDFRNIHCELAGDLARSMPAVLSQDITSKISSAENVDGEGGLVTLRDMVKFYFSGTPAEVFDIIENDFEQDRKVEIGRMADEARVVRSSSTQLFHADLQSPTQQQQRKMSLSASRRMSSSVGDQKIGKLRSWTANFVLECEHMCRSLMTEAAMARFRFFSVAWVAATKESEANAQVDAMKAQVQSSERTIADLEVEVISLRNLTMEASKLKELLKHEKVERATREATMRRMLGKVHFAVHCQSQMVTNFLFHEKSSGEQPRDATAEMMELARQWCSLFDSIQRDMLNPYEPIGQRAAKDDLDQKQKQKAKEEDPLQRLQYIMQSVVKETHELNEGSYPEQAMLSSVATLFSVFPRCCDSINQLSEALSAAHDARAVCEALKADLAETKQSAVALESELAVATSSRQGASKKMPSVGSKSTMGDATPPPSRSAVLSPGAEKLTIPRSPVDRAIHGVDDSSVVIPVAGRLSPKERGGAISPAQKDLDVSVPCAPVAPWRPENEDNQQDIQQYQHRTFNRPTRGDCECCGLKPAQYVCEGCWGASLCRQCIVALHGFLPTSMLERSNHLLESQGIALGNPAAIDTDSELLFDSSHQINQLSSGPRDYRVLLNLLKVHSAAAGSGGRNPKEVGKALTVSKLKVAQRPESRAEVAVAGSGSSVTVVRMPTPQPLEQFNVMMAAPVLNVSVSEGNDKLQQQPRPRPKSAAARTQQRDLAALMQQERVTPLTMLREQRVKRR